MKGDLRLTTVSRDEALEVVASKVKAADVVLDLGPGIRPQTFVKPYVHICVDAHRPYLEYIKQQSADDPKYVFINAPWNQAIAMLPDKSVDAVFALDFIEHLEKEDGLLMLREAERVARRQIVVFTPHGFFPQSYEDPHKLDRWGMDGGYWQTHRSGWELEDFGAGWEFVSCPDFFLVDEDDKPLEEPMGAIWAFRNLSATTDRRYLVLEHGSTWLNVKKIAEHGLSRAAYNRLRSLWLAVRAPRPSGDLQGGKNGGRIGNK